MRAEVVEKGEGSVTIKYIADEDNPTEGLILSMVGMSEDKNVSVSLSSGNVIYFGGVSLKGIAQFKNGDKIPPR